MEENLYERLLALAGSEQYPFHMPGHKRRPDGSIFDEIKKIDITEIEGFDNLHHPEDILLREMEYAAEFYRVKKTYFLVNGSSCGVLSAICSQTASGVDMILARNSHKSAYHAAFIQKLHLHYLYPCQKSVELPAGPVEPADLEALMEKTGVKVVFVTSPTYEGIVSNIARLAEIVHKKGGILIVDEAHGAHLCFDERFGIESACRLGADLVVQSLHKTMPTLTQTALLHVCSDRVDLGRLEAYLGIFQTSSPSYLFLASISACLHEPGAVRREKMDRYFERLDAFYEACGTLSRIQLLDAAWAKECYQAKKDPSKLLFGVRKLTDKNGKAFGGRELMRQLLDRYQLQMEMASLSYVIGMTSVSDTQEGFERLAKALFKLDGELSLGQKSSDGETDLKSASLSKPQVEMPIFKAMDGNKKSVLWEDSIDEISSEFLYAYPPGSPVLAPGERITREVYELIKRYRAAGLIVEGTADYSLKKIMVIPEKQ